VLNLIRLPEPARTQEYDTASKEIEDLLLSLPGIAALYRTGGVSAPGISDIDRIAVVDREAPAPPVWPKLSARTKQLAMHGPFLVDRSTFKRHRWFAYLEPLELSHGEPVPLEDRPLPSYSESLIAAESMVTALLSTVKQVSTGVVKVRPTLCQLNNLRHALALARIGEEEAEPAWKLAADVTALRNDWFSSPEDELLDRIRQIVAGAPAALVEALWALGDRSRNGGSASRRDVIRLAPPWSNVALVASDAMAAPRLRLPQLRSARFAEFAWRAARPRVEVHPGLLDLIAGRGGREVEDFRSARDELVRGYRDWLRTHGPGYAEIGLASAFLRTTAPAGSTRA
jgi:hypothetical protein